MSGLRFVKARVRIEDFIPQAINLVKTVDFLVEPENEKAGPPDLISVEFYTENYLDEWCFDTIYKYVKAAEKRGAEEQCFQLAVEWDCETETLKNLVAVARDGAISLWYPTKLWTDLRLNLELPIPPIYKEELVRSWKKMQQHASCSQPECKSVVQVLTDFLTDGDKKNEEAVSEVIHKLIDGDSE